MAAARLLLEAMSSHESSRTEEAIGTRLGSSTGIDGATSGQPCSEKHKKK